MGGNNVGNNYPIATYGGLMASMICASLSVNTPNYEIPVSSNNIIVSLGTLNELYTSDGYNAISSSNIFSEIQVDIAEVLTSFVDSVMRDSAPLAPEIEEYINDVFWELV